jgi:hypothetical protein
MNNLTVNEALKLLKTYSCAKTQTVESEAEKERLRQALLLIVSLSEWQNLGICADNSKLGVEALSSYLKALGYQPNFDLNSISSVEDPVYIKFNSQKMSHYLDSYTGKYRGVLVSAQAENDEITGTYGHFPLDLFA